MNTLFKICILLLTTFLLQVLTSPSHLQAKGYLIPSFAPDTMPNSIRILLDNVGLCNQRNTQRQILGLPLLTCNGSSLDPATYNINTYVTGVLKAEVGPNATIAHWHIEALKAMAITARTYGWNRATLISGSTYRIDSSGQFFFPEKAVDDEQRYQDAANLTNGQFLSHPDGNGTSKVINAQHRRQNGHPTNPCSIGQETNCPIPPAPCSGLLLSYFMDAYLKGVQDPISNGETRSQVDCNSAGLSQYGTQRWAIGNTNPGANPSSPNFPIFNYRQILAHYYRGIHIKDATNNNLILTPEYRWNPVEVFWDTTVFPSFTPSSVKTLNSRIQNSGVITWTSTNNRIAYQWKTSGGVIVGQGTGSSLFTIAPGDSPGPSPFLSVQAPATPGLYTLIIDMQANDGGGYVYFQNREANRPWYPLQYICVVGSGGQCYFTQNFPGGGGIYLPIIQKNAS